MFSQLLSENVQFLANEVKSWQMLSNDAVNQIMAPVLCCYNFKFLKFMSNVKCEVVGL